MHELRLWGREGECAPGRYWSFQGRCPGRKTAHGRQVRPGAGVGRGAMWSRRGYLSLLPVLLSQWVEGVKFTPTVALPLLLFPSESPGCCHVTLPLTAGYLAFFLRREQP